MPDDPVTPDDSGQPADVGKDDPQLDDKDTAALAKADNPDAVKNAIRRHQESARTERKRAEDAEARLQEIENSEKSEREKDAEAKAAAETRAESAERRADRLEVAIDKKLPPSLASRLQGDNKEELEADADKLLEDFAPAENGGGFGGGARGSAPAPKDMDDMIRGARR